MAVPAVPAVPVAREAHPLWHLKESDLDLTWKPDPEALHRLSREEGWSDLVRLFKRKMASVVLRAVNQDDPAIRWKDVASISIYREIITALDKIAKRTYSEGEEK
jgi:hypothetical protein